MDLRKLDKRLEAERLSSEKEQSLWQHDFQNATAIAGKLVAIVDANKKALLTRNVESIIAGKMPYLRLSFRRGFEYLEVQLVYFNDAFHLIAEKNSNRLYAFEKQLSPELTYSDLEDYLEQLITENV